MSQAFVQILVLIQKFGNGSREPLRAILGKPSEYLCVLPLVDDVALADHQSGFHFALFLAVGKKIPFVDFIADGACLVLVDKFPVFLKQNDVRVSLSN